MDSNQNTNAVKIDGAEVYQTCGSSTRCIAKGPLIVRYEAKSSWYILKVENFECVLSKDMPVLASGPEKGAVRTYALATVDGNYIIKIVKFMWKKNLIKLENILRESTFFATEEERQLAQNSGRQDYSSQQNHISYSENPTDDDSKNTTSANTLYKTGKATNNAMIKSAKYIAEGIGSFGRLIQTTLMKKPERETDEATAQKLAYTKSAVGVVASIGSLPVRIHIYSLS